MSDFDFSEILAEAEARLDDQSVPEHFGEELVLAEGEELHRALARRRTSTGRSIRRGSSTYWSTSTARRRFLRARTMLERKAREASRRSATTSLVEAGDSVDDLLEADTAFHDVIAGAPGNGVLRALLRSLSTSTVRARLWHGLADRDALDVARDEHARIYEAIAARDADLARAAALIHIAHNEAWLRENLAPTDDVPLEGN